MEDFLPDFRNASNKANEILICSNTIKTFPFSDFLLIQEMSDIVIEPYSFLGVDNATAQKILRSKDAVLKELNGRYILFYNEEISCKERIKFTAGHEFGHYYLGQDIPYLNELRDKNDERSKGLYEKFEAEADLFSAQLHAPDQILSVLQDRGCRVDEKFLIEHFGLSKSAAETRLRTYRKLTTWKDFSRNDTMSFDDIVLRKFKKFIDSIAPYRMSYKESYEYEEEMQAKRDSWLAEESYRR